MKKKIKELKFDKEGTFEAYHEAIKWAYDNGYSYGSMCAPQPTALFKGDCNIAKWKNLSKQERASVDGTITGDYREGPVYITIFE